MNNKLTVTTRFSPELIEQTLDLGTDDLVASKARQVIQLQDQGIRDALASLGWTPPDQANELRQQLDQALAEAESLRGRCGELELVVVHTKEVCAESLKRVVACWREDGVSGEHSNVANAYEDFIGGLPSASAWLLRRQAEAIEDAAERIRSAAATNADIAEVYEGLLFEAQRLRGEVNDD